MKAADNNLMDDDLVEMVDAGLFPATAAMEGKRRTCGRRCCPS